MSYQTGQIVEGKVTGIQSYGAFVNLDAETSGLIHISEISDGYVRDIGRFVHIGDTVRVKILEYSEAEHRAKLSLKALHKRKVFHRRRLSIRRATLPAMRIGFSSVAEMMPEWIRKAEEKER